VLHGAVAVPLEEAGAADKVDWLPAQERMPPRRVPGATSTSGKRIASQSEQEEADPSMPRLVTLSLTAPDNVLGRIFY
jgi:hypothetical protein